MILELTESEKQFLQKILSSFDTKRGTYTMTEYIELKSFYSSSVSDQLDLKSLQDKLNKPLTNKST